MILLDFIWIDLTDCLLVLVCNNQYISSMGSKDSYNSLLLHYEKIASLQQVSEILSWDQQTMMPAKGYENRARQLSLLSGTIHQLQTDPRILDLIEDAGTNSHDSVQMNLKEVKKQFKRATLVPKSLIEELSSKACLAQASWLEAKNQNDFSLFLPELEGIVHLKQNEADCIRDPDTTRYDALLNDFEPNETSRNLKDIFFDLKTSLIKLRKKVLASSVKIPVLKGSFSKANQLKLGAEIARKLGYDFEAGRIDLSAHPFCSGSNTDDVRITTHVKEADPFYSLFAIMHETGHALYEQGLTRKTAFEPIGSFVSMGVHESQSRLIENHVGRSAPFCHYTQDLLLKFFGEVSIPDKGTLFKMVNRVTNGFIRTEADELTYNLHIMLRFELEEKLIEGNLATKDLEESWNHLFLTDFDIPVPDARQGVLQDIHWSLGAFGYFPTYTVGNIYAAALFQKITSDYPEAMEQMEKGDIGLIRDWLKSNIYCHGKKFRARNLVERAIGQPITVKPLLAHLTSKFSEIYNF